MFGFKKKTEIEKIDELSSKAKRKLDIAVAELPQIRLMINEIGKEIQKIKDNHKSRISSLKKIGKGVNQVLVNASIEVVNFEHKMKVKGLKRIQEDCEDRIERIELSEKAFIISDQQLKLEKNK